MRIVVRVEISTLYDSEGRFNHQKMDRLAMLLSNLNNSGIDVLLVSSGAIALGSEKLQLRSQPKTLIDMMTVAAIGQAELIKFYQNYFDQYNQMVAQVLITSDIMQNAERLKNAKNTFDTLLNMNIIPVINENDPVSTSDIELDDNYPVAVNVAHIAKANLILIKTDQNSNYIIVGGKQMGSWLVQSEEALFQKLNELSCTDEVVQNYEVDFPRSISDIMFEIV